VVGHTLVFISARMGGKEPAVVMQVWLRSVVPIREQLTKERGTCEGGGSCRARVMVYADNGEPRCSASISPPGRHGDCRVSANTGAIRYCAVGSGREVLAVGRGLGRAILAGESSARTTQSEYVVGLFPQTLHGAKLLVESARSGCRSGDGDWRVEHYRGYSVSRIGRS